MYVSLLGRFHLGGKSLLIRSPFCLGMGENIFGAEKICCWSLIPGVVTRKKSKISIRCGTTAHGKQVPARRFWPGAPQHAFLPDAVRIPRESKAASTTHFWQSIAGCPRASPTSPKNTGKSGFLHGNPAKPVHQEFCRHLGKAAMCRICTALSVCPLRAYQKFPSRSVFSVPQLSSSSCLGAVLQRNS